MILHIHIVILDPKFKGGLVIVEVDIHKVFPRLVHNPGREPILYYVSSDPVNPQDSPKGQRGGAVNILRNHWSRLVIILVFSEQFIVVVLSFL